MILSYVLKMYSWYASTDAWETELCEVLKYSQNFLSANPNFFYLLGRLWNFGYRPMHLGEAFHGGIQGGQDSCMKDVKCNANL